MVGIAIAFANAFGQLLSRHRILVVHPSECLLVKMKMFVCACLCLSRVELAIESAFRALELVEEFRADGQQITSGQPNDLVYVTKTRAHDLRFVTVLLVVVVDAADGSDSGILVWRNLGTAALFFVPVVNAADEWRNQCNPGFGARHCLCEAEQERQIAVNAVGFQYFGRPDPLPRACDLDENAFAAHAFAFIQGDQLSRLRNRSGSIKA